MVAAVAVVVITAMAERESSLLVLSCCSIEVSTKLLSIGHRLCSLAVEEACILTKGWGLAASHEGRGARRPEQGFVSAKG